MSALMQVDLDHISRFCLVKTNEGHVVGTYPFVWLRDNCRCCECYHPTSRNRVITMADLDVDIVPVAADVIGETLNIKWPDGHLSPFPISWLKEFQFSNTIEDPVSAPVCQLWGKEMKDKIPRFPFADVISNDKSLYEWLEALQIYGLAIITDGPKKPGAILEIGKRVSFLKMTQYGETFQLVSEFEARNLGFTPGKLAFHVDLPYTSNPANIQMLHAIQQPIGTGGESQFADAVKVALDLKKKEPELFQILATTPMDFRDTAPGKDFHLKYRGPIIELSPDGSIKGLRFNQMMRAPYMHIPLQDVHKAYKAIKTLNTMLYDDMVEVKIAPGEIGCFDNFRLVHARNSFTVTENSSRHMEGGYIDWDQARSRMRVIREKRLNLQPL
ncbi:gamma-butyrobetaine dioxygenase-like [Amphiura filiformis]|uniref:gamma-butyrobetaine dioxygenase-like n=1 Tax=Amphiura filiformis TaxID=82378 RepID=UPI003B21CFC0